MSDIEIVSQQPQAVGRCRTTAKSVSIYPSDAPSLLSFRSSIGSFFKMIITEIMLTTARKAKFIRQDTKSARTALIGRATIGAVVLAVNTHAIALPRSL